ncbi:MAG: Lrp/AsnC family transcriptional regulator [Nitrososphaerota archaeon]|nr:Lrp/AsnC family transcriptional regulator [Nitrososphaerota archaeon]
MAPQKSDFRPVESAAEKRGAGQTFDDLDLKILRVLLTDSRASAREIHFSLGVSTSTITARMGRLRERGIIRGFTASVDFQKLGYELTVVTEIHVSKGKLFEMEREIAKAPGVCAVYDVTGEIDAIVISKCKDREALSRFTKALLAMPFIERTNSHVVLTTVKEDFRLPI